jgi:hypothetical protein
MSKPCVSAEDAKTRILTDLRKVKGCEKVDGLDVEKRGLGWFVTHVHSDHAEMAPHQVFQEARKIAGRLS